MKAMLLCAGLGERLLPLTRSLPKPALPVLGRPLLLTNLERLTRFGVGCNVVNLHHRPEIVRRVVDDASPMARATVRFSEERTILGTAGALRAAAGQLAGEGPFLVHNGDFLSDVDIPAAVAAHRRSGLAATLVLTAPRAGYSRVDVDRDGRVVSIAGRPGADPCSVAGSYLFTGLQILDEEILERIPRTGPSDVVRDVHLALLAERRLGSWLHDGFWWEFGTPESFLEGCLRLIASSEAARSAIGTSDPVRYFGEARVAAGPLADFHGGVRLEGRVALGMGSRISEGSLLRETVVLPEVWVGPGSSLSGVLVAPGVEIPAGFEAGDVMICQDDGGPDPLPAGVERTEGLLVRRLRAA